MSDRFAFPTNFVRKTVLRVRDGMSQEEVADLVGITRCTISRWCREYEDVPTHELRMLNKRNRVPNEDNSILDFKYPLPEDAPPEITNVTTKVPTQSTELLGVAPTHVLHHLRNLIDVAIALKEHKLI